MDIHSLILFTVILIISLMCLIFIQLYLKTKEISKHILTEKALNEKIINTISNPIFYKATNGVFIGCNTAFENYLGLKREEIIGKTVFNLAPKDLAEIYHEMDTALFQNPGTQTYETSVRYADGTRHNVIFNKATYVNNEGKVAGLVGVITDITERKRVEEELKIYKLFYENAKDIILFVKPDGKIINANNAAVAAYGYEREELIGMNIRKLREPGTDALIINQLDKAASTGILFETIHYRKNGDFFPVEVSSQVARFNNEPILISVIRDITERKQAEQVLKESEEKYRSLFENLKDVVLIANIDGRIVECNQAALDLFGYDRSDLYSLNLKDLYVNPLARNEIIHQIETEGFIKDHPVELRKKDGARIYGLVTASKWKREDNGDLYYQGILRDITQAKWAEQALENAHDQIKQLVESLSAVLISISADGLVNQWNSAAEKYLGIAAEKVLSAPFEQCGIKWDWKKVNNALSQCKRKNLPVQLDNIHYNRGEGQSGVLNLSITPVTGEDGTCTGYVIFGNDITEKKRNENQIALSQKLESIGQLASGIAHEINTPMQYIGDNMRFFKNAFSNIKELLEQYHVALNGKNEFSQIKEKEDEADLEFLMEEIPKAVEQSLEGIEKIRKLVLALKDFSHPGRIEKGFYDLNKGIEGTIIISKNEWKYVADLKTSFEQNLPLVYCSIDQINQVILNMIINSAQSIKEKIEFGTIQKGKITIKTKLVSDHVHIIISDTGKGIPQSIIHNIFDPFFTTKEVGKGTGQGLAIAHDIIVNKHKGAINVHSEIDIGTTFTITLPINDSHL